MTNVYKHWKLTVIGEIKVLHECIRRLVEIIPGIHLGVLIDFRLESFSHGGTIALYLSVDCNTEHITSVLQSLLNQDAGVFVDRDSNWTDQTLVLSFVSDTASSNLSSWKEEKSWNAISIFSFVVGGGSDAN